MIHLYVHLEHWCTNYGLLLCLKLKLGKLFTFYLQVDSVFCPEYQGTGIIIEVDKLERSYFPLSKHLSRQCTEGIYIFYEKHNCTCRIIFSIVSVLIANCM